MVDVYTPNPLADQLAAQYPERFEQVAAVKAPPKMFAGGTSDTPAFTASGIDPELLLRLPVGVRHAAAAEPDLLVLQRWFEEFAGLPEVEVDHEGLRAAKARLQDWIDNTDLDTRTPEQRAAADAAEYAGFFNPSNDRAAYVAEEKRREAAGEDPMPEFGTWQMDRFWANESGAA